METCARAPPRAAWSCAYRDSTSEGNACGTERTSSHRALSLVHVHPAGHLGCFTLRPSISTKLAAATHSSSSSLQPLHPDARKLAHKNMPNQVFALLVVCNSQSFDAGLLESPLCLLRKAPVQRICSAGGQDY